MAIVYMQIKHGLPNLQDDDVVGSVGRQNIDVWVGWGRPKGIPAHVSFADDLGLKGYSGSKASVVEWKGQKFLHNDTSVGELVKGFFEFYAKLTSETGKGFTSENIETHCLSVWKGGFVERGFPLDLRYDSKQQEYKRQRQLPAAAQQAEGIQPPPPSSQRSRPISGFSQPQEWSGADLVVQDPFLHDKVGCKFPVYCTCFADTGRRMIELCKRDEPPDLSEAANCEFRLMIHKAITA
jgi:hypothetical protein